ncbi:hypothetical protein QOZ80_2AG0119720 [Eleusine coracana subsp. coracana]|nr:hypothetical protein QOZ80_2AG0119720 [Eleusine coracana subsp. coracana]
MGAVSSWSSLLPDDAVLEILLRVPPEPIYLLRASLVCKKLLRLVREPAFLREFRARHCNVAPLVGFFYPDGTFVPAGDPLDRVAAEYFSQLHGDDGRRWRVFSSRHGRVLLSRTEHGTEPELLVWDPMTGDRIYLPPPRNLVYPETGYLYPAGNFPGSHPVANSPFVRAALVCGDDSEDCRSRPFRVVLLFSSSGNLFSIVYSSHADAWGDVVSVNGRWCSIGDWEPGSVLVRNEQLYWPERHVEYRTVGPSSPFSPLRRVEIPDHSSKMFGYNLATNWLRHVRGLDVSRHRDDPYDCLQVFKDGHGELGLAAVRGSRLHLFEPVIEDEEIATWSEYRNLDLDALLPPPTPLGLSPRAPVRRRPLGFDGNGSTIFLDTENGVFALHIESFKVNKVLDAGVLRPYINIAASTMIPYMSFFVACGTNLSPPT